MPSEKSSDFVHAKGTGCTVTIEASPGASKTEIMGVNQWRGALEVRIAAEPKDGAANEELISFLSRRLGLHRKEIRIVKGARSGSKILFIPLPAEKVRELLGGG